MNYEIELPDDLKTVEENVNLLWKSDGGLIAAIGFRAKVDNEPVEKFWPVNGSTGKATAIFEDEVFPHLRNVFAEELQEVEEEAQKARAAKTKAEKRAARLAAENPRDAAREVVKELVSDFEVINPVTEPADTVEAPRRGRRSTKKDETSK
jgi:hypothetical protein